MSHDEVESEWVDGWVSVLARCFGPGLQKVWPKYGHIPFYPSPRWLQKCF